MAKSNRYYRGCAHKVTQWWGPNHEKCFACTIKPRPVLKGWAPVKGRLVAVTESRYVWVCPPAACWRPRKGGK